MRSMNLSRFLADNRHSFLFADNPDSWPFGVFESMDVVYGVFETSPVSVFAASSVSAQPAMT